MPKSKQSKTIALDMDGVLVHLGDEHLRRLNAEFGTSYKPEDVRDFHYSFMTKPQRDFMFSDKCWHREDLYEGQSLTTEQVDTICALQDMGRVIVVTSPLLGHIKSKYWFLARYFDRRNIYLCSDKSLVRADVLVDDCVDNFKDWPTNYIIYDQPYNQGYPGPRAKQFRDLPPLVAVALNLYSHIK